MELVYLWVENYKNIQKQGFNFSPRFTCEYDDETKELTIDKNDDYIEKFFGDNINVTAIVGKNGSGKSSVLEIIFDWNYKTVLIYLENNQLYYSDSNIHPIIQYSKNIIAKKYEKDNFLCLNIYRKYEYVNPSYCNLIKLTQKESVKNYFKIYNILNKNLKKTKIPYFIYPEYIHLIQNKEYVKDLKGKLSLKNRELSYFYERHLRDYSNFSEKQGYVLYLFNEMLNFNQIVNYELWISSLNIDKTSIKELEKTIKLYDNTFNFSIDEYSKIIDSDLLSFKHQPNIHSSDLTKLIESGLDRLIFKYIDFFNFNFSDKQSMRSYENLSTGEKTIFAQFINLFMAIIENKKKELILFLDEPDNTLHPQWQKEYIFLLIEFLKVNFKNKKIHIILTSHSPFLLSDIPKQNIIFLDKNEDGTCKVVNGLKEKKQTFGANIHTLLSDSFFMEDGLMGEFAKSKIDKAIKLLNQDKLDEKELKYCEQIIPIIGEPIVKNQLQRMLDSKKISYLAKDTREEIEFLKHRIDLLSKRL
ncbi:MAG: Unknown protein [uncultured Sulfurovum sp.]|uniref:AAA+ ATPase domain-containing protein n=1 Tax=uncultured Sulfurovum sp. TaxID=269237 RepID=A0A6S6SIB0_9BACT|nr:MAG: Unknown protein [uncultured Sulfurovum sp.]